MICFLNNGIAIVIWDTTMVHQCWRNHGRNEQLCGYKLYPNLLNYDLFHFNHTLGYVCLYIFIYAYAYIYIYIYTNTYMLTWIYIYIVCKYIYIYTHIYVCQFLWGIAKIHGCCHTTFESWPVLDSHEIECWAGR